MQRASAAPPRDLLVGPLRFRQGVFRRDRDQGPQFRVQLCDPLQVRPSQVRGGNRPESQQFGGVRNGKRTQIRGRGRRRTFGRCLETPDVGKPRLLDHLRAIAECRRPVGERQLPQYARIMDDLLSATLQFGHLSGRQVPFSQVGRLPCEKTRCKPQCRNHPYKLAARDLHVSVLRVVRAKVKGDSGI